MFKKCFLGITLFAMLSISDFYLDSAPHASAATINSNFYIGSAPAVASATVGYSNFYGASTVCKAADYVSVSLNGYCHDGSTVSKSDYSYEGSASCSIYSSYNTTFKSGRTSHYGQKGNSTGSTSLTL